MTKKLQEWLDAYSLIQNQLTPIGVNHVGGGTYNNLFDAHRPFQIDGNFGCISGSSGGTQSVLSGRGNCKTYYFKGSKY